MNRMFITALVLYIFWIGRRLKIIILVHTVYLCTVLATTLCLFFSPSLSLSLLPSAVVRNLMQRCCISVSACVCQKSSWENLNSYTCPQTEHCSTQKAYDKNHYISSQPSMFAWSENRRTVRKNKVLMRMRSMKW